MDTCVIYSDKMSLRREGKLQQSLYVFFVLIKLPYVSSLYRASLSVCKKWQINAAFAVSWSHPLSRG